MKLITDKADASAINALSLELTKIGAEITQDVVKNRPACKPYLDALIAAAPTLHTLTAEAIERDYHKDGKLPKSPSEDCHHAKDLVVHPATVSVLVRAEPRAQPEEMLREMIEVKGHAHKTRALLK